MIADISCRLNVNYQINQTRTPVETPTVVAANKTVRLRFSKFLDVDI